jgi:negative regulator of flagellin synthesis FlgM
MKIGPLDPKTATPAAPAAERRTGAPRAPADAGTRVELSSRNALQSGEAGRADFDRQKVERIAQALRDGSYRVDAEAIADKLIANARELLAGR